MGAMTIAEKRATILLWGWQPRGMYFVKEETHHGMFAVVAPIYGGVKLRMVIPKTWPFEDLIDDRDIPYIYQLVLNYEHDNADP